MAHGLRFEWDDRKNVQHRRKHRVSFEEAQTAFLDDDALLLDDPDHSDAEDRLILIGLSAIARLLVVCHRYRRPDNVIRLISARKGTTAERHIYIERQRR